MRKSRREIHGGKKIMKKVKGQWIGALCGITLLVSFPFAQQAHVFAELSEKLEVAYNEGNITQFEEKEELMKDALIQEESQKAIDKIEDEEKENTVEEIRKEIKRQQELGLEVYIIQFGDKLEVIAEALEVDVKELAEINNIEDIEKINVGDILTYAELLEISEEESKDDAKVVSTDTVSNEAKVIVGLPNDSRTPNTPSKPVVTPAPIPETTVVVVEETTVAPETTVEVVEETTVAPETTVEVVEETTVAPETTVEVVEETTVAPEETTVAPEETTMNDLDQAILNHLNNYSTNLSSSFTIMDRIVSPEEILDRLQALLRENDYLHAIYKGTDVRTGEYTYDNGTPHSTEITINSTLHHSLAEEQQINNFVDQNIQTMGLNDTTMSTFDKVKAINDFITKQSAYVNYATPEPGVTTDVSGSQPVDMYYGVSVHSPYVLTREGYDHRGVCQAYAGLFQKFADKLGINALYVTDTGYSPDGSSEAHAWNKVEIDGQWYNLDTTWNDPTTGQISEPLESGLENNPQYFLVSDENFKDHVVDPNETYRVPQSADTNYQATTAQTAAATSTQETPLAPAPVVETTQVAPETTQTATVVTEAPTDVVAQ